jgi:transposase
MSEKELNRLELVQLVCQRRLSVTAAANQAGLSRQRMSLLINTYRREGHVALVSRRRGKPANNSYSEAFQAQVCGIVREQYSDFGPTLAAEYLEERNGIKISRETLRKWMVADGIWTTRAARRKRVQQRRQRRECRGELVQLDGSYHDWFEGRGDGKCCLLVYIDDATGELLHLEFVPSESTFALMAATRRYVMRHGRPLALYTDKAGVYRNLSRSKTKGKRLPSKPDSELGTQFTRALDELGIALICANSPQAKGRVERANGVLQDRMIKAMRLEDICDMDAANAYAEHYMAIHNAKFAKTPFNDKNLHRPLAKHDRMDTALCVKEPRTVSNDLTLQYDRVRFILAPNDQSAGLQRKKVMVYDYPDGRIEIRHKGKPLPYTTFDKVRHVDQGAIVSNKRLGAVLAHIQANQEETTHKRSRRAIRRQGQEQSIFD